MKRSVSVSTNSSKKMCFMEVPSDNSSEVRKDLPDHFFHLGGNNYVVVSDFSNVLRIHIRKFWRNDYDRLVPTKMGITLSPVLWQSLATKLDCLSTHSLSSKSEIIDEELMLSTVSIGDELHVTLQRYFQRNDFARVFLPSVCVVSESEWQTLRDMHKDVTAELIKVLFSIIFPKMVLKEIQNQSPSYDENSSPIESSDAELVLTTSMVELLKQHLELNIGRLFQCVGCEENYNNQLGHDCVTMNYNLRLQKYGDISILSIDLELLAREFVYQNIQIINYVTGDFLGKLDMSCLIQNAKQLYVISDPCPDHLMC